MARLEDFELDDDLSPEIQVDVPDDDHPVPEVEFLTGEAGTGKTYELKRRIAEDPSYGVLCATTGIAAVNLGTITINSLLKFFDTESLEDAYTSGRLGRTLKELVTEEGVHKLCIDEVSMMDAKQLDLIYRAMNETNGMMAVRECHPLGLVVTGDFCQLAPIKAKWAFEAECWPRFAENTTRLQKIWRQDNPEFLSAINALRRGDGGKATAILRTLCKFEPNVDTRWDGTTILPKNDEVDRMNYLCLSRVTGRPITVRSRRWGKSAGENKNIPDQLALKLGALVMLLANERGTFNYVNGDTGHIVDYRETEGQFVIELIRTGKLVCVGKLHRTVVSKMTPEGWDEKNGEVIDAGMPVPFGRVSRQKNLWHVGGVEYFPIRLGYASTVHKTQGLSLDRVQVDCRGGFFGAPAMAYVAVSRCRTPEGLRIVGSPETFAKRVKVAPEVVQWL